MSCGWDRAWAASCVGDRRCDGRLISSTRGAVRSAQLGGCWGGRMAGRAAPAGGEPGCALPLPAGPVPGHFQPGARAPASPGGDVELVRSVACAPAVVREMSAVCRDTPSPRVELLCTTEDTLFTVCGLGRSLGCVERANPCVRPRPT